MYLLKEDGSMVGWAFGFLVAMLLWGTPGWSYTEIQVTNGGSVKGQVTITGQKPRAMAFNLVTIPDAVYCGRISTGTGWRLVEDFIIGPKGWVRVTPLDWKRE